MKLAVFRRGSSPYTLKCSIVLAQGILSASMQKEEKVFLCYRPIKSSFEEQAYGDVLMVFKRGSFLLLGSLVKYAGRIQPLKINGKRC